MDRQDLGRIGDMLGLGFQADRVVRVLTRDPGWSDPQASALLRTFARTLRGEPTGSDWSTAGEGALLLSSPSLRQAIGNVSPPESSVRELIDKLTGILELIADGGIPEQQDLDLVREVVKTFSKITLNQVAQSLEPNPVSVG